MKNIVLIMALACLALTAQGQVVTLNLDKCREMALENSRKMSIAAKQQEKAGYDLKSYRAFPVAWRRWTSCGCNRKRPVMT